MGGRRSFRSLQTFDKPFRFRYGLIAGIDEAGRGPLAGPVVAAAVILPETFRSPVLGDSKLLTVQQRVLAYAAIQRQAYAIGVGIVEPCKIDLLNILRATHCAMRLALDQLIHTPRHLLVDGCVVPDLGIAQTAIVQGDGASASIAAASIVAKVTRDAVMVSLDREYPGYGFREHKGYCTRLHLENLRRLGPCAIHRTSFQPVRDLLPSAYEIVV